MHWGLLDCMKHILSRHVSIYKCCVWPNTHWSRYGKPLPLKHELQCMHTPSCSSFAQCVSKNFILMLLKQMFHAREHPNSYTLMKFSIYHASSTFGEQMPNITVLRKPLLLNNLLSFSPNEQHRSVIIELRQTAQQAALYLRRLGPVGSCPSAG